MALTFKQHRPIQYVPEGDGWFMTVIATEDGEEWTFNALVADRGQGEPTFDRIEADLHALAGDDYMRGIEELREHEQPPLRTLTHPSIVVLNRGQWNVTFRGPLSEQARHALDPAGVLLIGGHSVPGVESHSVRVEAVGGAHAIRRVREVLEPHGAFGGWQASPVAEEHRI
jgi:hypothetical protein